MGGLRPCVHGGGGRELMAGHLEKYLHAGAVNSRWTKSLHKLKKKMFKPEERRTQSIESRERVIGYL